MIIEKNVVMDIVPPVWRIDYIYIIAIDPSGEQYFFAAADYCGGSALFDRFAACGWEAQWGEQFSSGDNTMFGETANFNNLWKE